MPRRQRGADASAAASPMPGPSRISPPAADVRVAHAGRDRSRRAIRSSARQAANLRGAIGFDYINQKVRFSAAALQPATGCASPICALDSTRSTAQHRRAPAIRRASRAGGSPDRSSCARGSTSSMRREPCTRPARAGVGRRAALEAIPTATLVRADAASPSIGRCRTITFSLAPRAQYASTRCSASRSFRPATTRSGAATIRARSSATAASASRPSSASAASSRPARATSRSSPSPSSTRRGCGTRTRPADPQRLTSVGGGVRASFADRVRLDMTLAVPTKRAGLPGRARRRRACWCRSRPNSIRGVHADARSRTTAPHGRLPHSSARPPRSPPRSLPRKPALAQTLPRVFRRYAIGRVRERDFTATAPAVHEVDTIGSPTRGHRLDRRPTPTSAAAPSISRRAGTIAIYTRTPGGAPTSPCSTGSCRPIRARPVAFNGNVISKLQRCGGQSPRAAAPCGSTAPAAS